MISESRNNNKLLNGFRLYANKLKKNYKESQRTQGLFCKFPIK